MMMPEINVVKFNCVDVITTSADICENLTEEESV